MEKIYEVTFKGDTMNPEGTKKTMTETQIRQSRVFTDTFVSMIFNLGVKESIYHHETGIEYKRIQ